ncbi:hypothetical protein M9H77_08614 [Catharanthus roseus]|uniref:Uncharacterized protein n=1 Tax=Catharanthus roseus TaxID=4058 RepID=A0ACC0BYH0_CATRO|nr:hypothetical protein M9H77_08614 [Catharanthus roseus]
MAITQMVSYEPSMLHLNVEKEDEDDDDSDEDYDVSSAADDDNNPNNKDDDISTPSSQWFNNAPYDFTSSGTFLDMGSGEQIDDLIESALYSNYCSWYIQIKKKATHVRQEIARFTKEHTCLVQVHQNKYRNMTSKFISKTNINDPEIPISNVIQEVQVLLQTGYTYKRTWFTGKFAIERVFES